jgi:hypothetical protein
MYRHQQDAFATSVIACTGVRNLPDRQIGIADAAIDRLIFLPKTALELQADFLRPEYMAQH